LDVYKSSYDPDSLWSTPKNMGSPINSNKDDAYFVLERNQLSGFLSSDRQECKTCDGGACYKIYSVEKKPNMFQVQGSVYDIGTNRSMPGVLLTFKDIHGENEPFTLITDSLGSFTIPVNEGLELYVKAQRNGYFGDAITLSTLELTESKDFSKNFFLSVIPKEDVVIPGIEYESEKASLKPESEKVLDNLADFLNLNNNLKVEISSHTDERGDDAYNLKLSQERAKVCVDYLIDKGIAAERLIATGYGETQPIVSNAQTEEEHQKNRRTTLRAIGETEIKNK
jgi:OOP family OmpA-OmpF porin